MPVARINIRRPRAAVAPLTAVQVAKAYNVPKGYTGKGVTIGVIELGGGFSQSDLVAYFGKLGLPVPSVTSVPVGGGKNQSDGPNGADGEVLLDIEVLGSVAPGANQRVYFCPNTDTGFLEGIQQAIKDGCSVITISWGGPEDSWAVSSMTQYDGVFAAAKASLVNIFAASGDSGSGDGESGNHVDFPASSPNVSACGGTRLTVNSDGSRSTEVTWDDNDTTSATGGGDSVMFPGRATPDFAGNADPDTGYEVMVDGGFYVIGGTSAVAPFMAGMCAVLQEAIGKPFDFQKTILANPQVCFDVTSGGNGAFRAGPGRDKTTGFGVPDGGKLLAVLLAGAVTPPPPVTPPPSTVPGPVLTFLNAVPKGWPEAGHVGDNKKAALATKALLSAYGLTK